MKVDLFVKNVPEQQNYKDIFANPLKYGFWKTKRRSKREKNEIIKETLRKKNAKENTETENTDQKTKTMETVNSSTSNE